MKKRPFLFAVAALAALTGWSPALRAAVYFPEPNLITPGDTFSFDIVAFNASGGARTVAVQTTTFGTTQTFAGAESLNGESVTITSSETVGATTTIDTITVSTPTTFLPAGYTINGATIYGLEFDIGNANANSNPLNYLSAVTAVSSTGSFIYGSTNMTGSLTPSTTVATNGLSASAFESVTTNPTTTDIGTLAVHSFTYSFTYTNVPEPSTWALSALGFAGCLTVVLRRRRA